MQERRSLLRRAQGLQARPPPPPLSEQKGTRDWARNCVCQKETQFSSSASSCSCFCSSSSTSLFSSSSSSPYLLPFVALHDSHGIHVTYDEIHSFQSPHSCRSNFSGKRQTLTCFKTHEEAGRPPTLCTPPSLSPHPCLLTEGSFCSFLLRIFL